MKNYTAYHIHTESSLLDSCTNYKLYVDRAKELGQTAICFSEHGNTYNWIDKKSYCDSQDVKYLHGCEIYLTKELYESDNQEDDKKKIRDNYHTILIAKNYKGFQELNTLIDLSTQEDHFYYKPRITFEEFKNISDNVIKISACLASPLNKLRDENLIQFYDYLEVQPHVNSEEQKEYNKWLYEMSIKHNKPLIAGTDTHSLNKYKSECRSILQKAKHIVFTNEDEFDLTYKSYNELVNMFTEQGALPEDVFLEAIENTNVMAATVETFVLDKEFKYPKLYDDETEVFKQLINRKYKEKLAKGIIKKNPKYRENVYEEMRVFEKIGMVGFMLFMSELVSWCWDNNIPVGFCRGSVGGSTIAYLTDVIDVDPIVWNTVFSRFANEDRKEIGDIDIDISPSQRHLVYEYIIDRFGLDKTAYVLAIGTISDKGTIGEIGRALDVPLSDVARIKKEYEDNPEETKLKYPDIFYYFDGLVNTAVSQSMHPAGIIVSPVTLPDNYGTFWNEGKRILSINMEEIHDVSLVKYDILGLKNVEIIKDACEFANIKYPKSHELNWDDQDVWEHIVDSPVGIFQFEGDYAFDLLKKYKATKINHLSLVNASLRPSGESYRDRLIAREVNHNPSELIDELLKDNGGFLVFQEDTIKFLTDICGLSGSEADNVRRAIGRKQMDRLQAALPQILEGYCNKSDKPRAEAEEEAKQFLQIIEDSSNYQFGYNHSTGYSMIGYVCAYLRYYYPTEFITAYLNNANEEDIMQGTRLAKELGIKIEPVKFRHSIAKYSCDGKNKTIYKGIESIKYLNDKVAYALYDVRDKEYNSFIDLLVDIKDMPINSNQLEILTKLDFFSEFGEINSLLKQTELFNRIYGKKQFSVEKIKDSEIPAEILDELSTTKTEKTYKGFDSLAVLKAVVAQYEMPKTTIKDKLDYEVECLGYATQTMPDADMSYAYVLKIDGKYKNKNVTLYRLKTGEQETVKVKAKTLENAPLSEKDVIKTIECSNEKKWGRDAEGNFYQKDEYEMILKKYSFVR